MDFTEYQSLAMRTRGIYKGRTFSPSEEQLVCGIMGLHGESGEFTDAIKKFLFHNKPVPDDILKKEMGDFFWYAALICDAKGWDMGEIASLNIEKLRLRYPDGFNFERANAKRD